MRWVRSMPAFVGHPELQSFECRGCREALTISVEPQNPRGAYGATASLRAYLPDTPDD